MFRTLTASVLALALFVPLTARAQIGANIAGQYIHQDTGGVCSVTANGRAFLFVNEKGSQAWFQLVDPGRGVLQLVDHDGGWFDRMVVSVQYDRRGRAVLFFQAPGIPWYRGEYWVSAF
ncbi:MAG: hypothetical protein U0736_18280 [Gemmataceae bacterium]